MDPETTIASFATLFDKCLQVKSSDQILLLYDEAFYPYLESFTSFLVSRSTAATFVMVPRQYQLTLLQQAATRNHSKTVQLPNGVKNCIVVSSVILNALSGNMDTTALRRAIVRTARPAGCRFAHMPGVNDDILSILAASPMENIIECCEYVAWIIGESKIIRLVTFDSIGNEYNLTCELPGWDLEPIMSPGLIHPGSWGNIPPGETFCCPPLDGVNGMVCINGSVPDIVLDVGDEIILQFERGRLISTSGTSSSPAYAFIESEKIAAINSGDVYWNCFAELGIGLNPAITSLTGNSLFDEKVAGTVHIALGDNSGFGHPILSSLHADLVIRDPSLYVDNYKLIDRGFCIFNLDTPRPLLPLEQLPTVALDACIYLRENKVVYGTGPLMRRVSSANRIGIVRIADDCTAIAAGILAKHIETYGKVEVKKFIAEYPVVNGKSSQHLINLLFHYRVIGLEIGN